MLMLTPAGYLAALGELVRFDFAGANLAKAVSQIVALLSGPADFGSRSRCMSPPMACCCASSSAAGSSRCGG
jgi:hypothetical protein